MWHCRFGYPGILLMTVVATLASPAAAEIYKWVDAQGVVEKVVISESFDRPRVDRCVHAAMLKWTFPPTTEDFGAPRAVEVDLSLEFGNRW